MFQLQRIPIEKLRISKFNVRKNIGDVSELVASIKAVGVVEPIIVRPVGKEFEIIVGSRRFAAGRKARLKAIPAIVMELNDDQAVIQSLAENLQRGDLQEEELVEAYNILRNLDSKRWTREAFAEKIGKSRTWVSELLTAVYSLSKLREAGMKASIKTHPTKEERELGTIPRSHLEEIEYALRSDGVKNTLSEKEVEKKRVELAGAVIDLDYEDARKVTNRFKMYPNRPILQIKEQALAEKTGVALKTYLTPTVARQIEEDTGRSVEDALPQVIQRGLEVINKESKVETFTREMSVKEGLNYDIGRFECPIHKKHYTLKCDGKKVKGRHWVE